MDSKVNELRSLLKAAENMNRKLKSELDEISSTKNREAGQHDNCSNKVLSNKAADAGPTQTGPLKIKEKKFGHIDERFNALLARNAIDPTDGILQLRRILSHIATAPNNLELKDILYHAVGQASMKIFDCDMICLYMLHPSGINP